MAAREGKRGTTLHSARPAHTPNRLFGKATPGPRPTLNPAAPTSPAPHRPKPVDEPLDTKRPRSARLVKLSPGEQKRRGAADSGGSVSFGDYDTRLSFSQNARKSCTECNGPVDWVDEATMRERSDMPLEELADAYGVPVSELELWHCPNCGNAGAMGPATFGGF
jgi:hypothetical protein